MPKKNVQFKALILTTQLVLIRLYFPIVNDYVFFRVVFNLWHYVCVLSNRKEWTLEKLGPNRSQWCLAQLGVSHCFCFFLIWKQRWIEKSRKEVRSSLWLALVHLHFFNIPQCSRELLGNSEQYLLKIIFYLGKIFHETARICRVSVSLIIIIRKKKTPLNYNE